MAASQYLRPGSLLPAVNAHLTPDIIRDASVMVGESEPATQKALHRAVASVLGRLATMVASREGAENVAEMARDRGYAAAVDNIGSLFKSDANAGMFTTGQQLVGKIFGDKSSSIAGLLANSSGVNSSSAAKLLSLAAPLTVGVLGKRAAAQGLDASALSRALLDERSDFAGAAPSGLSQLLASLGPALVTRTTGAATERLAEPVHLERVAARQAPVEARDARAMSWLPLALAALAALVLLLFLRSRTAPPGAENTAPRAITPSEAPARVELPGGANISVPRGSINYNLAAFLADKSSPAPKTFVFDNLNFESNLTRLTRASIPTVNDLVLVLKAYPDAQVELVGHTDNRGSAQANQALSSARADAVKKMLVNQGVAADRIATTGYGQQRPVAPNNTEQGRARNRRLELNVTKK